MPISEAQLETWSHQGAVQQSRDTYRSIRQALEEADAPFADKEFSIFLQGSYGNDTNIRGVESDVDVVICLESTFSFDIDALAPAAQALFDRAHPRPTYVHSDFKRDVITHLRKVFGRGVSAGNKAIKVPAYGSRRSADVLPAVLHRHYFHFGSLLTTEYAEGIAFYTSYGNRVVNYPHQHADNCTRKHQRTDQKFKPMVRIIKNMRNDLIERRIIRDGIAPSYFIEGLLYNVPDVNFRHPRYTGIIESCLYWITRSDWSAFRCANEQSPLLGQSLVTWPEEDCGAFVKALFAFSH